MKNLKNILTIVSIGILIFSCQSSKNKNQDNLKDIAYDAFIYAYPMMEQVKTINGMIQYNKMIPNVVNNIPVYPMENVGQPIVLNNLTSMTGGAYIDISGGPVTLEVPEVQDRYIVYQFIDVFTHNFYYIGSGSNNGEAGQFIFYNKNQTLPENNIATPVLMEGDHLVMIVRIDIKNRSEYDRVREIQNSIKIVSAPNEIRVYPKYDKEKAFSPEFVEYINELITDIPEYESELFEHFAKIGIMRDVDLTVEEQKEVQAGIDSAFIAIKAETVNVKIDNGWVTFTELFGTREFLNGNYLGRALGAHMGLWGNSKEEAVYYALEAEGEGEIKFYKNQLPPLADIGFWSITIYDENYYVNKNEFDSYVLTTDQMIFDEDESITIKFLSKKEGQNWLYTSGGKMVILIRAYQTDPKKISDYAPPKFTKYEK